MSSMSSNARQVAQIFADRAGRWDSALAKGLRRAVVTVEIHATDLLSGSGAPGSYPVPVRTGNLRRSEGSQIVSKTSGIVFNDAGYARAIHSGEIAVGFKGRGRKRVRARPFHDDALKQARPGEIIFNAMRAAL